MKKNMPLILVLLLGLVVRLGGLFSRPIWYDEAFSLLFSPISISEMVSATLGFSGGGAAENHPLGYYVLLKFWLEVWGNSVWAARLLSIMFGILTVYLIYELAKVLVGKEKAWVVALFVAVSPFHVHYSQEIRMYALMTFALALATLSLFKGMDGGKKWWWGIFAVAAALAQYAQQLSGIYLACLALIPVFRRDKKAVLYTFLGGIGAVVLYLPWLVHLPDQIASTQVYWVQVPLLSRFLTTFLAFVAGLPLNGVWLWVGFGILIIVLVFGGMASVRILRGKDSEQIRGIWFAYLATVPVIALWGISQIRPVYIERALLTSAVMFSAWMGVLVASKMTPAFERYLLASLLSAGALIGVVTHYTFSGFSYADFEGIGHYLEEHISENELIVHSNKLSFLPMYYYFRDEIPQEFVGDVEGSATDTLHDDTQAVFGIQEKDGLADAVDDAGGIWFLIYQEAINEVERNFDLAEHPHLEWLNAHYQLVEEEQWGDLWVIHYRAFED